MTAAPHKVATADDLAAYEKGMEVIGGDLVPRASPTFEHGDAQSSVIAF